MADKPDITVALPTYNRNKELVDTIRDVLRQSHKNLELVVIDQSLSHDATTTQFLNELSDSRFRYFKVGPPSLPAARNFALSVSQAPLVLYLDDDVELHRDLVRFHVQTLAEKPDVSAVAGRVLQAGFPIKKEVLKFDEYGISHGVFTASEAGFTNTFPGGNHTVRKDAALAVGGYNTAYYGNALREESDLAMRMIKAGMKIYYEPRAELLHLAAERGGTRTKTYVDIYDTAMFYRNELFFTIRMVNRQYLVEALRRKYRAYCLNVRHLRAYRRRLLFFLGLIAAVWRQLFARTIVSKEL